MSDGSDAGGDATGDDTEDDTRTGNTHVCRDTGREDGLVGKYDIWLCRQSFRELAPKMGFEKYD